MKHSREFEIAFVGLKPGIHVFEYNIDSQFFDRFGEVEFANPQVNVQLTLDKKFGIFLLHFNINGKVSLPCDRCGDDFELIIWDEFDLVVKQIDDELVAEKSEADAEVAYIGRSESLLEVSTWIYEFILLSIPMQHIHPDNESGGSTCNPEALKYLIQPESSISQDWKEQLEQLQNKKNKN
ncbi:MAG TPA: DUF177 domain-containing protein [Chitinophagaceae bacterium]|nr:DUF177 domain-containing protein [Chitinophagaceae bacterium]